MKIEAITTSQYRIVVIPEDSLVRPNLHLKIGMVDWETLLETSTAIAQRVASPES